MLPSTPASVKFAFLGLFLLFSCKTVSQNDSTDQKPVDHLVVSFYSIGSGTNHSAVNALNNLLTEFTGERKLPVHVEKKPWGREGEVDYCIDLKELTKKDREEFINKTKEYLADQQWVRISENTPCREDNR